MAEKPNLVQKVNEERSSLLFMLNVLTTYAVKYAYKLTDNGEDLLNSNGTFKHHEDEYLGLPIQRKETHQYRGPLARNGI
ncbi:MAG: hypothetical protein PHD81_02065 [Candidatus Nanoarchaeia archaeon]|nr:hypothetical protein [Candidatus Nanoarchaeia archaeon]MDD5587875.1 hypothetical protein [Candidatus Nanoarchaeia archaeon]